MYEPIGSNGLTRLQHDTKFKITKLRRDLESTSAMLANNPESTPRTAPRIEEMQARLTALINNPTGQELVALGVI